MNLSRTGAELLRWYVEAGVDAMLDDEPHDRFAEAKAAADVATRDNGKLRAPAGASVVPARSGFAAASAADQTAIAAQHAANAATSIEALRAALEQFDGCALKQTAKSLVFATGNPQARVMMVGKAPDGDEDRLGEPFVARAGELLNKMLAAIGLDRTSVYLASVIPWRPPGNRAPTPQEQAALEPFIRRHIELANPDVLVCFGALPAQMVLGARDSLLKSRGRWSTVKIGAREIPAIATLHPADLLRQPTQKRLAWTDLKALRKALSALPPRE